MKLKVLYTELTENLVPTIGNQCPNYWEQGKQYILSFLFCLKF